MLKRFVLVLAFGVAAALFSHARTAETGGSDFTYHWLATRAVINGQSPYQVVKPGGPYHLDAGYLYPLTSTLVAMPFAATLSSSMAAAVFVGFSVTLLVFGITRNGFELLPMLGGIPALWAITSGQMSILATAGVLLPGLGWLAFLKPNTGLALMAYRPSRSMFVGGAILLTLSLAVQWWPLEWLHSIQGRTPGNYGVPMLMTGGPLILLALLRWRRPEARLLLVMALVPQSLLFYDQLALGLVAKTRNESMLLVICGIVAYVVASWMPHAATGTVFNYGPAVLVGLYLPCLVMVLRRPNEGTVMSVVSSRISSPVLRSAR